MGGVEKIVLVDDNESTLLFFQMLLERMGRGYEVSTTSVGNQAEQMIYSQNIHLVICAWDMKPLAGAALVQRIRLNPKHKYLPFLIYSKNMSPQDNMLAKELGIDEILTMPFNKEQATSLFDKTLKKAGPLNPIEETLRKAEGLIDDNELKEAQSLLTPSVLAGEYWSRASCNLARIWVESRQYENALPILESVLKKEPENIEALRLKSQMFLAIKRTQEGLSILKQLSDRSPKNIKSILILANAYAELGDHAKAEEFAQKAEGYDSDNFAIKDERAKMAFHQGDFAKAKTLLTNTKCGDELARYFNNLAISKVIGDDYRQAIVIYQNAIDVLTDRAKIHQLQYNLGLAFKKMGVLAESFRALSSCYLGKPNFEKAYAALVKVSKEMRESQIPIDPQIVAQVKAAWNHYKGQKD